MSSKEHSPWSTQDRVQLRSREETSCASLWERPSAPLCAIARFTSVRHEMAGRTCDNPGKLAEMCMDLQVCGEAASEEVLHTR